MLRLDSSLAEMAVENRFRRLKLDVRFVRAVSATRQAL